MIYKAIIRFYQPPASLYNGQRQNGFTLIELSIVLVIIGLLVGGVLVGRDLIAAAAIRSQVSQIEKYNTAIHTFQLKYGFLPGDIPDPTASSFGFIARGQYVGQGDGNGLIEGNYNNTNSGTARGSVISIGETGAFWVDLSRADLINGNFNAVTSITSYTGWASVLTNTTTPKISDILPVAAIGNGNYLYVWHTYNNINMYGLSGIVDIGSIFRGAINPVMSLSVQQAYAIDLKIDDGLPQSGKVLALYSGGALLPSGGYWAGGSPNWGYPTPYTTSTPATTTSCFDNGSSGSNATQKYSMGTNGGNGMNCALSFKFQ